MAGNPNWFDAGSVTSKEFGGKGYDQLTVSSISYPILGGSSGQTNVGGRATPLAGGVQSNAEQAPPEVSKAPDQYVKPTPPPVIVQMGVGLPPMILPNQSNLNQPIPQTRTDLQSPKFYSGAASRSELRGYTPQTNEQGEVVAKRYDVTPIEPINAVIAPVVSVNRQAPEVKTTSERALEESPIFGKFSTLKYGTGRNTALESFFNFAVTGSIGSARKTLASFGTSYEKGGVLGAGEGLVKGAIEFPEQAYETLIVNKDAGKKLEFLRDVGVQSSLFKVAGKAVSPIARELNPFTTGVARVTLKGGETKAVYTGVGYSGFNFPSLPKPAARVLKEATGLPFEKLTNLPTRTVTPKPFIGITETGKIILGKPTEAIAKTSMPSLSKSVNPEFSTGNLAKPSAPSGGIETAILTEPSVMKARGYQTKDITLTQDYLREAELLKAVKSKAIGQYPLELKTASPEVTKLTIEYLSQFGEKGTKELYLGGSFGQIKQSSGGRTRLAGDIEPYMREGVTRARGEEIISGLAAKIREAGYGEQISYTGGTKILGKTKEGELDHFIDTQFPRDTKEGEGGSPYTKGKIYGLELAQPLVNTKEGFALKSLTEQLRRKGGSALSEYQYGGKKFLSPAAHRPKDIPDKFYVAQELLVQGRKASPRVVRAQAVKELDLIGERYRSHSFPEKLMEQVGGKPVGTIEKVYKEYEANVKSFEQARIERYAATHKIISFNFAGTKFVSLPIRVKAAPNELVKPFPKLQRPPVEYKLTEEELYQAVKVKPFTKERAGIPVASSESLTNYPSDYYKLESKPARSKLYYSDGAGYPDTSKDVYKPYVEYSKDYPKQNAYAGYLNSIKTSYPSVFDYSGTPDYSGGDYPKAPDYKGGDYPKIPTYPTSGYPSSPGYGGNGGGNSGYPKGGLGNGGIEIPPSTPKQFIRDNKLFSFKGEKAFAVFVRRKGKFLELETPKPLTRSEALVKGLQAVGTSAAATFKIRPTGKLASANPNQQTIRRLPSDYLYKPKSIKPTQAGEELFTERSKYRIKSRGELEEITFKGIAARRKNKTFGVF